jgi:hypothetical protein
MAIELQRSVLRCIAAALLLAFAVACDRASEQKARASAAVPFPFAERIGWLHGACLAIANPNLVSGTPVVVVITGAPQKVAQARIAERTDSPQKCQALLEGRAAVNAKPGMIFYALESGDIDRTNMGVGVVAPPTNAEVVGGLVRMDLDRSGHGEVFSSCATTEGIKFAVWSAKAYQGEPRWSGYYYLDYETQPNCP